MHPGFLVHIATTLVYPVPMAKTVPVSVNLIVLMRDVTVCLVVWKVTPRIFNQAHQVKYPPIFSYVVNEGKYSLYKNNLTKLSEVLIFFLFKVNISLPQEQQHKV